MTFLNICEKIKKKKTFLNFLEFFINTWLVLLVSPAILLFFFHSWRVQFLIIQNIFDMAGRCFSLAF